MADKFAKYRNQPRVVLLKDDPLIAQSYGRQAANKKREKRSNIAKQLVTNLNESYIKLEPDENGRRKTRSSCSPIINPTRKRRTIGTDVIVPKRVARLKTILRKPTLMDKIFFRIHGIMNIENQIFNVKTTKKDADMPTIVIDDDDDDRFHYSRNNIDVNANVSADSSNSDSSVTIVEISNDNNSINSIDEDYIDNKPRTTSIDIEYPPYMSEKTYSIIKSQDDMLSDIDSVGKANTINASVKANHLIADLNQTIDETFDWSHASEDLYQTIGESIDSSRSIEDLNQTIDETFDSKYAIEDLKSAIDETSQATEHLKPAIVETIESSQTIEDLKPTIGEAISSGQAIEDLNQTIDETFDSSHTVEDLNQTMDETIETNQAIEDLNLTMDETFDANQLIENLNQTIDEKFDSSQPIETGVDMGHNLTAIGTLVWARLAHYPYWPAFIYPDAESFEKKVHVKFLADNGRVSWISFDRIIEFEGLQAFQEYAKLQERKMKKSSHRSMFNSKTKKWDEAVCEASTLLLIPIELRTQFYDQVLCNLIYTAGKLNASRIFSIENSSRMYRSSSTPSTVDTAYSSMKPSPRAMGSEDDYPMDTCEINVASIENDAISVTHSGSSPTTSVAYDDTIETSSESVVLYNVFKESVQKVFDSQLSAIIATDSFKVSINNIWKIHQPTKPKQTSRKRSARTAFSTATEARSITPTTSKNAPINVASTSRKRPANTVLDSAPRAKRERRLVSIESRSGVSPSPIPPIKAAVDPQIALQKAKEREDKLRERIAGCIIKNCPSTILFRDLQKGPACNKCLKAGNVARCTGPCKLYYHAGCTDSNQIEPVTKKIRHVTGDGVYEDERVLTDASVVANICCTNCRDGKELTCFVCAKGGDTANELIACTEKCCSKYFHRGCLRYWPQSRFNVNNCALTCPYHVCQTCQSDDVRNHNTESDRNLIKCLKCPASYHRITHCIPAGSKLLSDSCMICPRHRVYNRRPVNANWCFFCGKGGGLVCCETCPATYCHTCLDNLKLDPGERYVCEICESGRLPLYGEIVWVKYCGHKWWPAIICPPWKIPENVRKSDSAQSNYFCVCFFGRRKEYGWLCKDNVYRYEDGDADFDKANGLKHEDYRMAVNEAKEFYKIIEDTAATYKNPRKNQQKPTPYKRIKFNKPIPPVRFEDCSEISDNECSCTVDDEHPCSETSNCINYSTYFECGSHCKAKEKCENQRFQKLLYANVEVRSVQGKGFGLFAKERIVSGKFIIEYVGEVINSDEFQRRFQMLQQQKNSNFYFLSIDGTLYIDAGPKGNDARFINHSCEPNVDPQKWTVNGITRIGFFANSDIPAGTEITFNYNWAGDRQNTGLTPCFCGTTSCGGFIGIKRADVKTSSKKIVHKGKKSRKKV